MPDGILVSLPLSDLLEMYQIIEDYPQLCRELDRLRKEVDGLRSLYTEALIMIGDSRRKVQG